MYTSTNRFLILLCDFPSKNKHRITADIPLCPSLWKPGNGCFYARSHTRIYFKIRDLLDYPQHKIVKYYSTLLSRASLELFINEMAGTLGISNGWMAHILHKILSMIDAMVVTFSSFGDLIYIAVARKKVTFHHHNSTAHPYTNAIYDTLQISLRMISFWFQKLKSHSTCKSLAHNEDIIFATEVKW